MSATRVLAQSPTGGPMSSIVQKIADTFHLNKNDVQAVFDQARSERQTQMEATYEDRLTQFVKDGKITETQKQLIIEKHKELLTHRKATMSQWQNMTFDQRKAAMQAQKQALSDWATQNNIDPSYLFGGMGMKGRGFGR